MKYGPIICDPRSEEAKALVGKKVIGSHGYIRIDMHPDFCTPYELSHIDEGTCPFVINGSHWYFIREVIEEEPKYRPYKDTEEMVEDFKKRFCGHTTIPQFALPLIWIKGNETNNTFLVHGYLNSAVTIGVNRLPIDALFDQFTYLDGSPVGKEEEA